MAKIPDYLLNPVDHQENIPPPVVTKIQELPFDKLSWENFERLCKRLVERDQEIRDCRIYGRPGQKQRGIDLITYPKDFVEKRPRVYQCKRVKDLSPDEISKVVHKFLKEYKKSKPTHFVLCCRCLLDSTKQQDSILAQSSLLAKLGIVFEVWDGEKLSSVLKDRSRIVDDFFSREWVKAFNGPEAADALERQFETSTEAFLPDISRTGQFQASQIESLLVTKDVQIQDLKTALDEELSQACDKIKHLYRRGARTEAAKEIRNYVNRFSTDLHGISKSVKAKFFYTAGEIIINTQPGLDEAKDYLQKIKQIAPSFDARILEARIKLAGIGKDRYDDALLILQPIDKTEIFNLNLGILLEQDRLTEFQNLLLNPPVEADDVTAQLKAYYYRLQRDFTSAESAIQEAIGSASQYPSHHVAAGHICFWSAVPKNLDSPPHAILPQTFHPFSFVPSATGMSNLRRAFDHYEKALILVRTSYPQEVDYILELMGYQLLCLAYHTQEHEAARQLAEAILKEEPSNFIALFYCLEWGISFDMDKSIDSLETKRAQGQSDLNDLFALTRLYESKDEFDEAISLLKEERGKFYTEKEQYVWTSRILELVLSKGDETFAWQILNDYPSEDVTLKLRLEALFYDRMGNHPRLEEVGIKLCETTDTLLDLQNLCGFYRKTEQWGKLLPYSRCLLEICFDPSSCSLHIQALYYNRDYGECLKILDKAATLYLDNRLPDHLLRIKIECLRKLNRWNDAVYYMETLAHQKPSTDLFHNLVHAYVQLGKTEKAIAHLRLVGDASWADSELLMTGSQLLISTSPVEAFHFAEKAREKAMEDPRAWLNYIEAGFLTGHDGEALSALSAFQIRFPESLLLQRVELDSLFKQAKEWQEQRKKRWEMYRSAKVSAHMIADMERIPLGLDWFVRLKHNSSITLWDSKYPVWVQYGGKQKASLKDANAIIADYTALLIAFELKLLPYIEQAFGKIILPPSLLAVIQAESLRASEFQLSRLENCQLIKGMIDKGYISVLSDSFNEKVLEAFQVKDLGVHDAALFYLAEENLGLVLAHHLYREDERRYQLNSGLREKRVFVHEILVALRKMGSISENDLNKALKPFADSQPPREVMLKLLEAKPLIITDATTIELFSELGMLEHLLQTFSMALPRFEAESVLQALQNYQLRQHATEWLEDIRHYLSDRLDQKYCFPTVAIKNGEGERHAGPCTRLLEEIVQIVQEQPLPVWVDDRFTLQYERIEQVPILGTVDILSILSDKGIISEQDRYGYLIKMMERNIQFLNPDPGMVFHYLKVTGHDTLGKLKESFELKTIRRYFNNILVSGTALDPLPSMMGKPPEAILYFIKYQGTIRNILVSLWSDSNIAAEQKESDSTWIFHHLFRSFDEVAYLFPSALDDLGLTSLTQYYLLAIGFNILLEAKNKPLESATGYFQWLYTNYLADQWEVDPKIETATIDKLASFIIEMATKGKKEYRETFVKLSSILMAKIPKEITEALFNISGIEQLFHGYLEKTVTLPGGNRLPDYVWQSWINQSIEQGKGAIIEKEREGQRFKLCWTELTPLIQGIRVENCSKDEGRETRMYFEPFYKFSHPSNTVRLKALDEINDILELTPESMESIREQLKDDANYKDAAARIEEIAHVTWRYFWTRLTDLIDFNAPTNFEFLFPANPKAFSEIFQFENSNFDGPDNFNIAYINQIADMLDRRGIEETMRWVLSLPFGGNISSEVIIGSWVTSGKITEKDRKAFILKILNYSSNPIVLQNGLATLLPLIQEDSNSWQIVQATVLKLLQPSLIENLPHLKDMFDFYISLLHFAWNRMQIIKAYNQAGFHSKIIYSYLYAGEFFNHLDRFRNEKETLLNYSEIGKWLSDRRQSSWRDAFKSIYGESLEVMHPDKASYCRTILAGTLNILTKHKEFLKNNYDGFSDILLSVARELHEGKFAGAEEQFKPFLCTGNFFGSFLNRNLLDSLCELLQEDSTEATTVLKDEENDIVNMLRNFKPYELLNGMLNQIVERKSWNLNDIILASIILAEPIPSESIPILQQASAAIDLPNSIGDEKRYGLICILLAQFYLSSKDSKIRETVFHKIENAWAKEENKSIHFILILEAVRMIFSEDYGDHSQEEFFKWWFGAIEKIASSQIKIEVYEQLLRFLWKISPTQKKEFLHLKERLSLLV